MKKIALLIFQDRIASRLDSAEKLMLVKVEGGKIISRELILLEEVDPLKKADKIVQLNPDILICGGLTENCEEIFRNTSINVFPWIQGNAENILSLCVKNTVIDSKYYNDKELSGYSPV
jgi:predicted Fe-Mo cluster-binding NifX family protein